MSRMTLDDLYDKLSEVGIPVFFFGNIIDDDGNVEIDSSMPFVVYRPTYTSNFGADDRVYQKISNYQVDLYTEQKDIELEETLEDVLSFTFWQSEDFPTPNEKAHRTTYTFKII